MTNPKTHQDVDARYTWNAPSVFPTADAWDAETAALADDLGGLQRFQGQLANGPQTLADAIDLQEALLQRAQKVYVYASMSHHVDTTDQAASQMLGRAQGLYAKALAAVAFLEPELLAIGQETLQSWMRQEPRLAGYGHYLENLFRTQAHVRTAEVEELLGLVADPFAGVYRTFGALSNADLSFPPARNSQGVELTLTQGTYDDYLHGPDREARRTAWQNYHDAYLAFKNTLASNLATSVKQRVFLMKARRHQSTLEAALFPNSLPIEVFHNLIATFRKHLPIWHRYWEVRRKALGVSELHPYDIWAPLVQQPVRIPYEQAVGWIADSLAPLGKDYVDALRRGCAVDRWVDVYPTAGKTAGAFSSGSPGTHPFILTNYNDDVLSLGTLAHELGHSMHSYLIWQKQPFVYSDYSAFIAEVASNFHQAMLRGYMFSQDIEPALRIGLIEEAMNNFHRYFLIMPTLARLELEMHQGVEEGRGLTADQLIERLADLFGEAYGDGMALDRPRVGIQWATFPHLYMGYYVFQYATGISGAHALARRVLSGEPGAAEAYLAFLETGSSRYPLDALRLAGVDLTSPQPVEETFQELAALVEQLDDLVG